MVWIQISHLNTYWVVWRVTWLCVNVYAIMKWNKTTMNILQWQQSIVTSWQCQQNILEEKKFVRQKATNELSLPWKSNFGIHEDCFHWLLECKESILLISPSFHSFHTNVCPVYLVDELGLVFYTPFILSILFKLWMGYRTPSLTNLLGRQDWNCPFSEGTPPPPLSGYPPLSDANLKN